MTDAPRQVSHSDFVAIGPRIWRAVAEPATVTIGLVAGDDGALLIDTGSTPAQGAAVRTAAETITGVPVTHVVLTHSHFDHAFGLAGVVGAGGAASAADASSAAGASRAAATPVTSIAHQSVFDQLSTAATDPEATAHCAELGLAAHELALPTRPISALAACDLGGRRVEFLHPGRGHTAGDLVVVVPDADVVFVGDLVEEATPPWFGPDTWPREWAATLDAVIGLLSESSTVVVGHGAPVHREFVIETRSAIAAISYEIESLIGQGVALVDAEARGHWAYPFAHVAGCLPVEWERLAATFGTQPARPAQGQSNLPLL